jgi:hypothetical protein
MKFVTAIAASVTLLAGGAQSAAAAPVTINVANFSGGTAVLHAPGTLANNLPVMLGSVLITGDLGTFESYCVDLQHFDVFGPNQTYVNTMDNWNNTAIPAHAGLGGGAASWLYNTYALSAAGNTTREAALSLAIWNSLYDNDFSVFGGTGFWATSLSNPFYGTLANQYLQNLQTYLSGHDPLPNDLWLQTVNIGGHYAQDFIAPAPVPEPATLALLGAGLLCGAIRRRRRENAAA